MHVILANLKSNYVVINIAVETGCVCVYIYGELINENIITDWELSNEPCEAIKIHFAMSNFTFECVTLLIAHPDIWSSEPERTTK